jgi:hypothetical protein
MSTVEEHTEAQRMASRLSPLLKEYTEKLRELCGEVRTIQESYAKAGAVQSQARAHLQLDFEGKRFGYNRLSTPATDLIRQASQLVEHGKVETVTRLELALRLAEFEVAFRDAQKRVGAGPGG